MSIQEHVILVNDQGMVIGTQEKYAAHTTQTLCIWPSPPGCLTPKGSVWSPDAR
jgi:hypothetical protein